MHRLFDWLMLVPRRSLGTIRRRPRQTLILVGISVLVLGIASPFLWAGYHWFAGQAALKRYHSSEAYRHFKDCLKVWPWSRSVRVHLLAARAARREADYSEAFRLLHEVQSTLDDKSADTLLEWALLHAAGGDLNKVEGYLYELSNTADQETLLLIFEAIAVGYARTYRTAEALIAVNEWLTRDPDNVEALFLRASIFRKSGAWTKAVPDLRRVVELDPQRPWTNWWLSVGLVYLGYYDEAIRHLELLRQHAPPGLDQIDVLVRMAMCRHRMGRSREARELLDEVLAQRPNHGLALLTRGQIDQVNGQLPQAEKWLRRAAEALPYDYKAHWSLTECLRQEGKAEEAHVEEAYANNLKDRWERFSEIASHQLSQRPHDPALHCELGKLMLELGMPEGAENCFFSALLVEQHYAPALNALADYYAKRGDSATAEDFRRQAQENTSQPTQPRSAQTR